MKLLELTGNVYERYKKTVRDREDESYEMTRKLLTRNMHLAKKADSEGYESQMYKYGRLWFLVDEEKHLVVWLRNFCHNPENWEMDMKKREQLNKELGITPEIELDNENIEWSDTGYFNNKVKLHSEVTRKKLVENDFMPSSNLDKNNHLILMKELSDVISFNMVVDLENKKILDIAILDEDYLQHYDYQRIIMTQTEGRALEYATKIYHRVVKIMNRLQDNEIITGYDKNMYI